MYSGASGDITISLGGHTSLSTATSSFVVVSYTM